jgi:23S rRNA (adenine2503-C2)-methyltransferase
MLDLTLDELALRLGSRTRAVAVRKWIYALRTVPAAWPDRIAGVRLADWQRLCASAPLPLWELVERERAADGTVKLGLRLGDALVETVLIPGSLRSTVCVSSQSGCSRRCSFCATGTLGLRRSLGPAEIVLQYLLAQCEAPPRAPARNVVFMGMGEPLDNLDAVLAAQSLLLENPVPALSFEHVTVSTSGIAPAMRRFLREARCRFALSLNATTDEQRLALMPQTRQWPIAALLDVLREDAAARPRARRYFIEYVLLDEVNDSARDAERLVQLIAGLPAHVNLIQHNPFPASPFRPTPPQRAQRFFQIVQAAGVRCLLRAPRGPEIGAACGQLALRARVRG